MGVIWTSKTRTTQPTGSVGRNVALVGSGVVLDLSKKHLVDSSGRAPITYRSGTATVSVGVTNNGISRRVVGQPEGNPASPAHVQIPPVVPLSGAFTLLLYCRPSAFNNDGAVYITGGISTYMQDGAGSGPFIRWGQGLDSASRKKLVGFAKIGGTDVTINDGTDCVEGTDYVIALVYDGAALRMYKNGVQVASSAASGSVEVTGYTALVVGDDYVNSSTGASGYYGRGFNGDLFVAAIVPFAFSSGTLQSVYNNPWQLFAPEKRPLFFSTGGGANTTGTLAVTLDAATLTGVGGVARSGTLATTLDAATLTGVGNVTRSGILAVTLDAATLSGTGAVTTSGTLSSTLDAVTLAGVGSVAVGTNRDGTLAVTLDAATLAGVGGVARSGTLAVTLDAATLAGVGTAGQAVTGTLGVTLGNVTLAGIGAIPAAPSAGGGKTFGSNKKKKKQRKAIESEEWLKAEETAKQLLQDRFTKTTPEAKLEALASHIESLQPVIEALKALAGEDVQEAVQETKTEELTEHQLVLNRFDALEKKIESVEELLIILMADL